MTATQWTSVTREAERGIRFGILAVFVVGVRRRDPGATLNAAIAFAASYLPGLVERRYDVEFRPWQRMYTETALLTHSVGMLGPYDDVWWWDHLTHTHSSTLVGGLAYAAAHRRGADPRRWVLGVVAGGGGLWEVGEYAAHSIADRLGIEPVLVFYGQTDTLLDLCFNLLGALLVIRWGDRLLDNFTACADDPQSDHAANTGPHDG